MWESLKLSGDGDNETGTWVKEAIKDNSLVAVTDGSYMKELYPDMNSCAFILECSKERGGCQEPSRSKPWWPARIVESSLDY
jgi:hypothetical protein